MSFKWAQEHDLNAYRIKVLYSLVDCELMTQKQICAVSGMPKQTVNNIIRALEKDEMIMMKTHDEDKREKVILLTDKGNHYLQETLAPLMELESRVVRRMGEENYALMLRCLTGYSEAMEQEMEQSV